MVEIVKIKGKGEKVDESVLRQAERLLENARDGDLESFVVVFRKKNGDWGYHVTGSLDFMPLLGALDLAKDVVKMQLKGYSDYRVGRLL